MRIEAASSPGHVGRPNEDFVGVSPGAVVVLDGAGIPGTEHLCHHGTAWYAETLGTTLLSRLAHASPADALADAIEHVTGLHRHTCDVADPSSPQATVAAVRFGEEHADYLVLADTYVLLGHRVVTDPREVDVRNACLAAYDDRDELITAFRARRNRPGGYWIAKDDPAAAREAVTGRVPLAGLDSVALLSNGAVLPDWATVLTTLRTGGPDALLRRVRDEGAGQDDATVAWCDLR